MRLNYIKAIASVMAVFLLTAACVKKNEASASEKNVVSEKEFPISEYSIISAALPYDIIYEQKEGAAYLKVVGNQENIDNLNVVVKDNILQMTQKKSINNNTNDRVKIYTNSKELSLVSLNGSSDLLLRGTVKGKKLDIRLEGSGDLKAEDLQSETLSLGINGSGDAELHGKSIAAAFNINGSGDIDAKNYQVESLRVYASGSGDVVAYVSKDLYANSSGSGDIVYLGNPAKVTKDVTGSGDIHAKK